MLETLYSHAIVCENRPQSAAIRSGGVAMSFKTETVSVRDGMFQVEMRCAGRGEPLVWLHHSGGHQGWFPFLDRLAEKYMVFQPDHPGWGNSTGLEHLDDIVDFAIFYLDFFDALKIEKPYLIGHSLGGMVAAEVAALDRDSVRKLVLCGAAGLYTDEVGGNDFFAMQGPELVAASVHKPENMARLGPQVDRENREAMARAMFERQKAFASAGKFIWPIWDKGLKKRIHRVAAPTLIVWGQHDGIVPAGYAEEFHKRIPGSRVVMFSESAHFPMVEEEDRFIETVTGFLAE
jgi:pimeloyl-ACP methyl ester carboxylesterase